MQVFFYYSSWFQCNSPVSTFSWLPWIFFFQQLSFMYILVLFILLYIFSFQMIMCYHLFWFKNVFVAASHKLHSFLCWMDYFKLSWKELSRRSSGAIDNSTDSSTLDQEAPQKTANCLSEWTWCCLVNRIIPMCLLW